MELTPANLETMFQTYNFAFENAYASQDTFYKDLATEVPSTSERQLYPFLKMIPTLREWVGPRVLNNISASSYSLTNKHWELTVSVDKDRIADDSYGIYTPFVAQMGQQMKEWKDRELARVIEAGTTSLCWDGQYFFDTDHPVNLDDSSAGTQSNKLVGAGYDIAVSDPRVAYRAARSAMALWKRDDGLQLGVVPDTIMVHPNEEEYARLIVDGLFLAQTIKNAAGNDNVGGAGTTNIWAGKGGLRVIVNPFLTVTSGRPWYLMCTRRVVKPFIWQNRQEAVLTPMVDPTSPNVFFQRELVYGGDVRGAAGYSLPWLAFRCSAS